MEKPLRLKRSKNQPYYPLAPDVTYYPTGYPTGSLSG